MSAPGMDPTGVVTSLVEMMLPRFSGGEIGLHVSLSFAYRYYDMENEDADRLEAAHLHFCFVREANYTKVFRSIQGEPGPVKEAHEIDDWELVSDHDSGWREDGVRSSIHLLDDLLKKSFEEAYIPVRYLSTECTFNLFGAPAKVVSVEVDYSQCTNDLRGPRPGLVVHKEDPKNEPTPAS